MSGARPGPRHSAQAAPGATQRLLHDIVYSVVEEVCWDADYLYRSFTEHFAALMAQIYDKGGSDAAGSYTIPGIKSGREVRLSWRLEHRLDFHGPNCLRLDYRIEGVSPADGGHRGSVTVELGSGRVVDEPARVPRRPPRKSRASSSR